MTKPRSLQELSDALGVSFHDLDNLKLALYHRSYLNEAADKI
jgi:dsRNA-specific ribonuclease